MKLFKQKTWQFETSGVEGEVKLFGVNIFDYKTLSITPKGLFAFIK